MNENRIAMELEELCFSYASDAHRVMDHLNFKLVKGEKTGLIGHNGSGKTTFLHVVMGLLPVLSGTIRFFGNPVSTEKDFQKLRQKVGLLFQNADDQLFSPTVLEDVAFGPLNMGKTPAQACDMSRKTLSELNLDGFENRITHKLSGGEKKLVSLATVLVMEPEVLLLDEPTTGLDESTRKRIIAILNNLDISCIIVSHEYDFLVNTTQKVYSMEGGRLICNGDSGSPHNHYHSHPLGKYPHHHKAD